MNTKVLTQANSLSSGSTLWILPQPTASRWSAKIDWYLNGLITRSEQRQPQTLSPTLTKILKDEDLNAPLTPSNKHAPLLISSHPYLPNHKTLVVDYEGNVKDWINSFIEVWAKIQRPSIRVFLPSTVKSNYFLEQLPKMKFDDTDSTLHVTIVDDKADER